jgi:hypothetical protein
MWKKQIRKALFIITVLAVGLCSVYLFPVHTAATTGINQEVSFEGKIVSASGINIPDGTYNTEFKIYAGGTATGGGTLRWTEDYLVSASHAVTFTSGTFQVNLGSITAFGSSIDWNTYPLYLSLQIGSTSSCTPAGNFTANCGGDGEMSPYILLTSTPYALNSNELGGLTSAAYGQLASNQTWTGTNIFQPTTNINSATVRQTSAASPTADIFDVQGTDGSTNFLQITSTAANQATVALQSVGGTNALSLTSAGALSFTGAANSTWDIGANTLSLQTTNNGAITTGTGLLTVGGNLSFGQAATIGEVVPATADAAGFALSIAGGTADGSTTGNVGGNLTLSGGNAAGSGDNNGGNLILSGGTKTGIGTGGSVIVQPQSSNDSTTAFQIQNSSAAALLTADTTNMRLGVDVTYAAMDTPGALTMGTSATGGQLYGPITYYYEITAVDSAGGETAASPVGIRGTAVGSTSTITIKWAAITGAYGYRIYRSTSPGSETLYDYAVGKVFSGTTLIYTDTGAGSASGGAPPSTGNANAYVVSTNTSNNNLQLSIGGNGTPTGQLYVSGTVPNGALGGVTTGLNPYSVYVQGRYAYVANYTSSTLGIYDVSNPASPVSVGSVATGSYSYPISVYVQGRYAYVANSGSGTLGIYDVSNPASPVSVGSVATGSSLDSVYVQGRYAYVAEYGYDTLGIYDVSNPASPVSVGSVLTGGNPQSVYVQGRYAYVAESGSSTLGIYDVSNPANPVNVGSIPTGGSSPYSVYVQGRYAYVTSYTYDTLLTFDLGGAYTQQLEAGGTETGTLQVDTNATVSGEASIQGGLQLGANLQVAGSAGINGNLNLTASTLSAPSAPSLSTSTSGGALPTAHTYYYQLAATSANGTTAAIASSPTSVTTGGGSTNKNTLTWSTVYGATGYIVYRSTNGTTWYSNEVSSSTTSIIDNGGTTYSWINAVTPPIAATTGGNLTVGGTALFKNATNSDIAFQVQNASGSDIFTVDTLDSRVGTADQSAASTNSNALLITSGNATGTTSNSGNVTLDSGTATGTAGSVSVGTGAFAHNVTVGNATTTSSTTIQGGTGSTALSLQVGASGTLSVGTTSQTSTLNLGNTSASTTTLINGGTGGTAISLQAGTSGTILVGTTNVNTVTIGSTANTGTLTLGQSTAGETINIGNGGPSTSAINTINIGATYTSTGKNVIAIGTIGGTSTTTIQGGTGSTALSLQVGATGTIKIGTTAQVSTLILGTTASSATTTLNGGSGAAALGIQVANNATINIGTASTNENVTIGSTNNTGTLTFGRSLNNEIINIGNGNIAGTFGESINIGNGSLTGGAYNTIQIGTSADATSTDSISIGNEGGSSGLLLQAGTGNLTADVVAGSSILLGTTNTETVTVGSVTNTNTLTLGQSTAGETINIGNGSVTGGATNYIYIGTQADSTSGDIVTIGNSSTNSETYIGGGDLLSAQVAATGNIHIGDNNQQSSLTLGNYYASSTTLIKGGTGSNALSLQAGTNGYINIGTSHSNQITIGSVASSASVVALFGGTGTNAVSLQTAAGGTIALATYAQSNTVQIGNTSISTGNTQNINIGNLNAAGTTNVTIGTGASATGGTTTLQSKSTLTVDSSAAINIGPTNATSVVLGGNTSATISEKVANTSTTAYQLQTAGATALLTADTTNSKLTVGATSATPILLVLANKNTSGDPTEADGAMYYNSNTGNFRCGESGTWENCIGGLMSSNTAASSANNTCTTACNAFSLTATLPANYCVANRVIHIVANGVYSDTAAPTFGPWGIYLGSNSTTQTSDTLIGGATPTSVALGTVTNQQWFINYYMTCNSTTSITGEGTFTFVPSATGSTSETVLPMSASAATTGLTTTSAQTIYLFPGWGTSSASNTATLEQLIVTGN